MSNEVDLLKRMYACFNAGHIDAVLAVLHPGIMWANTLEGGYVRRRDNVRLYWKRVWAMMKPHVEPVRFASGPGGEIVVEVHLTAHDLEGKVLADRMIDHIFEFENGLITCFDIREH